MSKVYCVIDNDGETVFAYFYGYQLDQDGVSYGKWFSVDDFINGNKKVILPNYPYLSYKYEFKKQYKIGEFINICGESYEAICISSLLEYVYQIPYNSIVDKALISKVAVVTTDILNENRAESFVSYAQNLLCATATVKPLQQEEFTVSNRYFADSALICGIMSMSIFNLVYLYAYVLGTRKKKK